MSIFGEVFNLVKDIVELPCAILDGELEDKLDDIKEDLFGED